MCPQTFGGDELPRGLNVITQVRVADVSEFDTHPTAKAHVRWIEKGGGIGFDERRLHPGRNGQPDGDMTILVVVVGEHDKHFVVDKKGGFAVRNFFARVGKHKGEAADTRDFACDLSLVHKIEFVKGQYIGRG